MYESSGTATVQTQDGPKTITISYNIPGIGRVGNYAGSWYGPDLLSGRGSSVSEDVMAGYGLPRRPVDPVNPASVTFKDGQTINYTSAPNPYREYSIPGRPLMQQIIYDVLYRNATWNASIETDLRAEVARGLAAGLLTGSEADRIWSKKDDPVKAMEEGFWLPPGGGDVPLVLQGNWISDTGSVHPDVAGQTAQTLEILNYTAEKRQTSLAEEVNRLADKMKGQLPEGATDGEAYVQELFNQTGVTPVVREASKLHPVWLVLIGAGAILIYSRS